MTSAVSPSCCSCARPRRAAGRRAAARRRPRAPGDRQRDRAALRGLAARLGRDRDHVALRHRVRERLLDLHLEAGVAQRLLGVLARSRPRRPGRAPCRGRRRRRPSPSCPRGPRRPPRVLRRSPRRAARRRTRRCANATSSPRSCRISAASLASRPTTSGTVTRSPASRNQAPTRERDQHERRPAPTATSATARLLGPRLAGLHHDRPRRRAARRLERRDELLRALVAQRRVLLQRAQHDAPRARAGCRAAAAPAAPAARRRA